MDISEDTLAKLEEIANAATDGPWTKVVGGIWPRNNPVTTMADIVTKWTVQDTYKSGKKKGEPKGESKPVRITTGMFFPAMHIDDATFVVTARTAVPKLIAEVRRLRALLNEKTPADTGAVT